MTPINEPSCSKDINLWRSLQWNTTWFSQHWGHGIHGARASERGALRIKLRHLESGYCHVDGWTWGLSPGTWPTWSGILSFSSKWKLIEGQGSPEHPVMDLLDRIVDEDPPKLPADQFSLDMCQFVASWYFFSLNQIPTSLQSGKVMWNSPFRQSALGFLCWVEDLEQNHVFFLNSRNILGLLPTLAAISHFGFVMTSGPRLHSIWLLMGVLLLFWVRNPCCRGLSRTRELKLSNCFDHHPLDVQKWTLFM